MNKAYKVIWNVSRQAWVIVGEPSKTKSQEDQNNIVRYQHSFAQSQLARRIQHILLVGAITLNPLNFAFADIRTNDAGVNSTTVAPNDVTISTDVTADNDFAVYVTETNGPNGNFTLDSGATLTGSHGFSSLVVQRGTLNELNINGNLIARSYDAINVVNGTTVNTLNNTGLIQADSSGYATANLSGTVTNVNNTGEITNLSTGSALFADGASIISNGSTGTIQSYGNAVLLGYRRAANIAAFTNNGTIKTNAPTTVSAAIRIGSRYSTSVANFNNTGSVLSVSADGIVLKTSGTNVGFTNSGTISALQYGLKVEQGTELTSFNNAGGTIRSTGTGAALYLREDQDNALINAGTIENTSTGNAIWFDVEGQTEVFTNSGTVSSSSGTAINADTAIKEFVNTGNISGGGRAIDADAAFKLTNSGTISGDITHSTTGPLAINQSAGTISGDIISTADAAHTLNFSGGTLVGNITLDGTTSNSLVLDGISTISGNVNIGTGIVSVNQDFTTSGTINATNVTIASGKTLTANHDITGDITNNGALTFDRSDATSYSGSINGSGSLIKNGSGTLTLTNDNTYTGTTTINGSTLQIGNGGTTGSITGDIINNGALTFNRSDAITYLGDITGNGSIALDADSKFTGDLSDYTGELTNRKTLRIDSGEILSLGGSYTQSDSGTLSIGVASDTSFGKLTVMRDAQFEPDAKIAVDVTGDKFTVDKLEEVVKASGTLTATTFAVTDNSALFDFDAVKDGNTIDLTVTATRSDSSPGQKKQTLIEAKVKRAGLSQAYGAAASLGAEMASNPTSALSSKFVSLTTDKQVVDAVETVLPTVSGGVAQLTNLENSAVTSTISARQDSVRGLSSGDEFMTDRHIWLKPFGGWTKQDNRQNVTGYDVDSYGLAAGMDGDITSTWNAGFAFAYINSDVSSNLEAGSQSVDMDTYLAKVYATHDLDETTALNLQAGIGLSNYDSARQLFTGEVASADYDSWSVQLSAELDRSYPVADKTTLTPYVHADYAYVNVESYTESGAGALSLDVDSDSADSLVLGAGVKGDYAASDALSLSAKAGVGYDVMTDQSSLTSGFVGGGAKFNTQGIEPDEVVYNAGFGATYSLENGTEITAKYNVDARQDYTDQALSANFRMMF